MQLSLKDGTQVTHSCCLTGQFDLNLASIIQKDPRRTGVDVQGVGELLPLARGQGHLIDDLYTLDHVSL